MLKKMYLNHSRDDNNNNNTSLLQVIFGNYFLEKVNFLKLLSKYIIYEWKVCIYTHKIMCSIACATGHSKD